MGKEEHPRYCCGCAARSAHLPFLSPNFLRTSLATMLQVSKPLLYHVPSTKRYHSVIWVAVFFFFTALGGTQKVRTPPTNTPQIT